MQRIQVDADRPLADVIDRAAAIVVAGGVVAYPTDTLYGLATDPFNAAAIARLFDIKQRVADQPIPLIACDLAQVEREAGMMTELGRRLAASLWPGPLTLVLKALPAIVSGVHAGTHKVAVRVPDHPVARALAERCGRPITSTSANLSGAPATCRPDDVRASMGDRIDALLDAGQTPGGQPSTIVDVTGRRPALVRAGVVPWNRVLECV